MQWSASAARSPRACPDAVGASARRGRVLSRAWPSEAEVDEGGDPLRAEDVDDEEHDGQRCTLDDQGAPREQRHQAVPHTGRDILRTDADGDRCEHRKRYGLHGITESTNE